MRAFLNASSADSSNRRMRIIVRYIQSSLSRGGRLPLRLELVDDFRLAINVTLCLSDDFVVLTK